MKCKTHVFRFSHFISLLCFTDYIYIIYTLYGAYSVLLVHNMLLYIYGDNGEVVGGDGGDEVIIYTQSKIHKHKLI